MENSSKALLMAAGILVFILIVSVLVYMYQAASELPKTQEQIKEAQELAAFNKQYEVYNRSNLKGTDVASVVNRAISYNEQNTNLPQINVKIKLKEDLSKVITYYKDTNSDGRAEVNKTKLTSVWDANSIKDLKNNKDELENVIHFSTYETKDQYYSDSVGNPIGASKPANWLDYYVTDNVFATFKRMKFKCIDVNDETSSGVTYDSNGKISEINFVQI